MNAGRDQDFFWEGIDCGKFLAQCCADCAALRHPPSPACANCGSLEMTLEQLSGRGTVCSCIVSRHPSQPDAPSRLVIIVELEEGLRFVSNLVDADRSEIGVPVQLVIRDFNGKLLPLFRPAEASDAEELA
jgi:uncharacterized OB-fold protein